MVETAGAQSSISFSKILQGLSPVDLIIGFASIGIAIVAFYDDKTDEMIKDFLVPLFGLIVIGVFVIIFMLLRKTAQQIIKILFRGIIKLSIIGTLIPFTFLILWVLEGI